MRSITRSNRLRDKPSRRTLLSKPSHRNLETRRALHKGSFAQRTTEQTGRSSPGAVCIRPFFRWSATAMKRFLEVVQFLAREVVPEFLRPLSQRVPSAVLPEHQLARRHSDRQRIDDRTRRLFLEVTVLMNPRLVRERVAPHDGLIRLRAERDDRAQQLARRVQVLRVNARVA